MSQIRLKFIRYTKYCTQNRTVYSKTEQSEFYNGNWKYKTKMTNLEYHIIFTQKQTGKRPKETGGEEEKMHETSFYSHILFFMLFFFSSLSRSLPNVLSLSHFSRSKVHELSPESIQTRKCCCSWCL